MESMFAAMLATGKQNRAVAQLPKYIAREAAQPVRYFFICFFWVQRKSQSHGLQDLFPKFLLHFPFHSPV
ncbi:MAG: hypothetical protein IJD04_01260 [Desulfovibrionaceae bacterium]|nr:hypothetical protein [Desulfovibrionaceae bacterium]